MTQNKGAVFACRVGHIGTLVLLATLNAAFMFAVM